MRFEIIALLKSKLLNFSSENIVILMVQEILFSTKCNVCVRFTRSSFGGDWFIEFVVDGPGNVRWSDAATRKEQLRPNQPLRLYCDSESMGKISK